MTAPHHTAPRRAAPRRAALLLSASSVPHFVPRVCPPPSATPTMRLIEITRPRLRNAHTYVHAENRACASVHQLERRFRRPRVGKTPILRRVFCCIVFRESISLAKSHYIFFHLENVNISYIYSHFLFFFLLRAVSAFNVFLL